MPNQALIRKPVEDEGFIVTLDDAFRIGDVVAKSKMFPEVTDQARAVVAILAGRELGIPPMASLRNIHVIKGKVELAAGLIAAMVRKSERYEYSVITDPDKEESECVILWTEYTAEGPKALGQTRFTLEDARRAKLIKPDSNWEKFPRAMLFARALTEGQRKYCPEIGIGPVYAPGEIAELDAIDITPERQPMIELPTAKEVFNDPRPLPNAPLPVAWTEDTAARQLADQEIANKINAGLKTISNEIAAEAPTPLAPEAVDERAKQIAEAREKNIAPTAEPDPVPALKPTLTTPQQKVLNAMGALCKEHGKDKAAVWESLYSFIGRKIKRSAELSDEEAGRVYTHLQTLASEFSAETKPAPAVKYDRRIRAHGEQIGNAIDLAIKRLTILNVPFGPVSDSIAELVEREFGRRIANRFELTNEEAQSALEYLQTRILEKECEIAVKADEV